MSEIWNNYNGLFLDSDENGTVYTLPGNNGPYQLWLEQANGRRSNAATSRCLAVRVVEGWGNVPLRGDKR